MPIALSGLEYVTPVLEKEPPKQVLAGYLGTGASLNL
jgi:hypothetical protein